MTGRGLDLALRLLAASCTVAALGSSAGCFRFGSCSELSVYEHDSEFRTRIIAVSPAAAVDEKGRLRPFSPYEVGAWIAFEQPLHDVFTRGRRGYAVGDHGLLVAIDDSGAWTRAPLQTDADLRSIVQLVIDNREFGVLIIGPELLLRPTEDGWVEVPGPVPNWRGLRGLFLAQNRLWAVSEATLWSANLGENYETIDFDALDWTMHPVEPVAPLVGGTTSRARDPARQPVIVFGEEQLYRFDEREGLQPIDAAFMGHLVDAHAETIYSSGGTRLTVAEDGSVHSEPSGLEFPISAVAIDQYSSNGDTIYGTPDGRIVIYVHHFCGKGRPWTVGGHRRVAARIATQTAAFDDPLGDAWFADALDEHASIASFARFGQELLSLGAPAGLVRAALTAQADELRHTSACLALARRHGVHDRPGALPIGLESRAGDPAAVAAALIDEGCVGESVAANEAELASQRCEDGPTRASLARIASDEREHAALAFASLRWLLEQHGDVVAPVLRERVATLRARIGRAQRPSNRAAADGRLDADEREQIARATLHELVLPLLEAMLVRGGAAESQRTTA